MEMSTFYVHGGVVVRGKDHLTENIFVQQIR